MPQTSTIRRYTVLLCAALFFWNTTLPAQDTEPNDSTGQAIRLQLPYNDTLGAISTQQDVDFYKFAAVQGQEITLFVRTASMGSTLIAALGLYDSDGTLLAYNDRGWDLHAKQLGSEPILYIKAPWTGTFYVSVSDRSRLLEQAPGIGGTGVYQLVLWSGFDEPAVPDRFEPNDSTGSAKAVPVPSQSDANLLYFGDIDWYQFTARRGEKVVLDVDALDTSSGFSYFAVKTRLGVFDRYGNLLDENDGDPDPDSGFKEDPALVFQPPYDGKFFVAVTLSWDDQYSTGFTNDAFLENPYVSSRLHQIGYYRLNLGILNELVFPQIANGSFGNAYFTTSLLLANYSSGAASGNVDFFNADGTPMRTRLEPGAEPASSCWFSIPPKGTWVIKTDGEGPGTSGYAVLRSSIPIGATAVFAQHRADGTLVTEAGVAAVRPLEFFTIPVDVTGEFNTGVAIANMDQSRDVNLYLKLLDPSGKKVDDRDIRLEAGEQMSIFVSGAGQLFPEVTNFRGSLQVFADAPVPAAALRSSSHTLSTLPAVGLNQSQNPVTLYFPHVVNGRAEPSYSSTIILTNPGYFQVSGTLAFSRFDGSPQSTIDFRIDPQGTSFIDIPASSEGIQRGYATMTADRTVSGVIIFSQYDSITGRLQTEVAVEAVPAYQKFCVFAEREDEYNTGIAVANVNAVAAELAYHLDAGTSSALDKGPVTMGARQQSAEMVAGTGQLFPTFSGRGTLEVNSTQAVPAVALRISRTSMTALPVIPIP